MGADISIALMYLQAVACPLAVLALLVLSIDYGPTDQLRDFSVYSTLG